MTAARHLRAAVCLAAITLNLIFGSALLLLLLPAKASRRARPGFHRLAERLYRGAVRIDNALLRHISGVTWRADELTLDRERPHIVLANHRSWADILVVQSVVATRGPIVKFLSKRELLYVPIFGLVISAFDFPVLRRRARCGNDPAGRREDDRRRVGEACAALIDSPAAILSFAEGTRFRKAQRGAKAQRADRALSCGHVLPPRVGGFATMVETLASSGGSIVDLTLVWPGAVSLWSFLGGAAGPRRVAWETAPIAEVAAGQVEEWLNERWRLKDELLRNEMVVDAERSRDAQV